MTSMTYEPMLVSDLPAVAHTYESPIARWVSQAKRRRLERRSLRSFQQYCATAGAGEASRMMSELSRAPRRSA